MGVILSVVLGTAGVVLAIVVSALGRLAADDLKAWSPKLVDWLIQTAVTRLPEDQRERLDEEWRSHVNDVPGEFAKVYVAAGCIFAARTLAPKSRSLKARTAEAWGRAKRFDKAAILATFPLSAVLGAGVSEGLDWLSGLGIGFRWTDFAVATIGGALTTAWSWKSTILAKQGQDWRDIFRRTKR